MHSDDFDEWARKPRPLPAAGGGSGFAEEREERRAATQGRYLRSEAWAFGTQCRAHMLSRRRYRPDRGASGGVTVCPEGVLSGRSLLRRRVALEACCSTDGILRFAQDDSIPVILRSGVTKNPGCRRTWS